LDKTGRVGYIINIIINIIIVIIIVIIIIIIIIHYHHHYCRRRRRRLYHLHHQYVGCDVEKARGKSLFVGRPPELGADVKQSE